MPRSLHSRSEEPLAPRVLPAPRASLPRAASSVLATGLGRCAASDRRGGRSTAWRPRSLRHPRPPAPAVTISPLPGTPDATPSTQISFLGAPASDLHDITVVGSRSGAHPGRLVAYKTAAGASFLPSRGFDEGERVTVTAVVGSGASRRRIGTSFTIARLYSLPSEPLPKHPADSPADVQSFHSRHDLSPPVVDVTVPASNPSAGDIFITSATGPGPGRPDDPRTERRARVVQTGADRRQHDRPARAAVRRQARPDLVGGPDHRRPRPRRRLHLQQRLRTASRPCTRATACRPTCTNSTSPRRARR